VPKLKRLDQAVVDGQGRQPLRRGGQRDDGNMGCGWVGLQVLTHFHPIYAGHHHIEEDQVGLALLRQGEGCVTVGARHFIARIVQDSAEHLDDVWIIVHDQDQFPGHPSS
jgi:hypothetical protein